VNAPRGFTLAELFVAMFVLSVGIVAVAAALGQATSGVEVGRGETAAIFLAEQRLELLKSWALEDWSSALLQAGRAVEAYGTIVNAARYRRETIVVDHAGRECASSVPSTVACKRIRVTVSYRPVSGGGGLAEERRVDLVTVLVSRAVTPTS
jgi:prepilin-type N-terminal cleavage/methylation domain-containing protein